MFFYSRRAYFGGRGGVCGVSSSSWGGERWFEVWWGVGARGFHLFFEARVAHACCVAICYGLGELGVGGDLVPVDLWRELVSFEKEGSFLPGSRSCSRVRADWKRGRLGVANHMGEGVGVVM